MLTYAAHKGLGQGAQLIAIHIIIIGPVRLRKTMVGSNKNRKKNEKINKKDIKFVKCLTEDERGNTFFDGCEGQSLRGKRDHIQRRGTLERLLLLGV